MQGSVIKTLRPIALAILVVMSTTVSAAADESTPSAEVLPNRAIAFYPEETGEGSYISVEVKPGDSVLVEVILGNAGEIEQTLRTYAVPATSGTNGGFILSEYGTQPDGPTSWVNYPESEFTFAPTEGVSLAVEITVPEGTGPGEYVTGLAAEQKDAYAVPGTDMIVQRVRWVVPILVTVPGDRDPSFDLVDATLENRSGVVIAEIGIVNTGNVIIRPTGEVKLLDPDGRVVGTSDVGLDSVYRDTSTTFIVAWENVPPADYYEVQVILFAEDRTVSVEKSFVNLVPTITDGSVTAPVEPLLFTRAELIATTRDNPPSLLMFEGEIANNGEPIEDARVSIVTYQDGVEVDRYPIMQAVTLEPGTTPVEARYSLPGGFTEGTYTFEVTIELGSGGTQTILATQDIDFEVTVGD